MKLAMYNDCDGLTRAWGQTEDQIQAEAMAKIMLEAYRNNGSDHSFQEPFTLQVTEILTSAVPLPR